MSDTIRQFTNKLETQTIKHSKKGKVVKDFFSRIVGQKGKVVLLIVFILLLLTDMTIHILDYTVPNIVGNQLDTSLWRGIREWGGLISVFLLVYILAVISVIIYKNNRFKEQEEGLKFAIDSTTDGLWDWNIITNEAFFAPRWKKKLGYKDHEIDNTYQAWLSRIHPEDKNQVLDLLKAYLERTIDTYSAEYRMIGKDGAIKWMLARGMAKWDSKNKPMRMVGTHTDITDKKLAEEALKRTLKEKEKLMEEIIESGRMRTEFFNNTNHEFRTLLNVILGTIQLIDVHNKNQTLPINRDKIETYVNTMRQNCYRLLRLVNNQLDITKLDSGFMTLNLGKHNIVNIVEDIILSVAQYIENNGIHLEFDTEVEEKMVSCDVDKIERIILNLLSNAVKYNKPGGSIYVKIYDRDTKVLISVKDLGIGIPKDKLKLIFERFGQAQSILGRQQEGSGIGLSLVKSFVELHNGAIWVESQLDKGSEFWVEIPVSHKDLSSDNRSSYRVSQDGIKLINIEMSDID